MLKIWGRNLQTGIVELIDTCGKYEVYKMLSEYQMAFGKSYKLWVGLKRDEP
jgi:hypothetical protein